MLHGEWHAIQVQNHRCCIDRRYGLGVAIEMTAVRTNQPNLIDWLLTLFVVLNGFPCIYQRYHHQSDQHGHGPYCGS